MMHRRWLLAAVTTLLIAVTGTVAPAQPASEYSVKAAFVFNVANFVEWPAAAFPSPAAPLRVAVVSAHPLPDFVRTLTSKTVRGRSVTVGTFEHADQLAGSPHIVFVAADAASELRAALKSSTGYPVLTIAEQAIDMPGDAVITVGVSKTRLAFAVNLDAADAVELKISPNLLKLAKSVRSTRAKTK